MIDKNDVKMPIQRRDEHVTHSPEQIQNIEELLRLVNEADNRQELRLKQDYYATYHWFGNTKNPADNKSYFSYQEEAVYDFVFNLNKSGILSDQVGMGKTIEAGMIISELASRNELRSLLIIVPNEIMAQKWVVELEDKFGMRKGIVRKNGGNSNEPAGVYPEPYAVKNLDDFARLVFNCLSEEKFRFFYESMNEDPNEPNATHPEYSFIHHYKKDPNKNETLLEVVNGFLAQDIRASVDMINRDLEDQLGEGCVQVEFDGKVFSLKGTDLKVPYVYNRSGKILKQFDKANVRNMETEINTSRFAENYKKDVLTQDLSSLLTLIGYYFMSDPEEMESISMRMAAVCPILVVPISYTDREKNPNGLTDFLKLVLRPEVRNYKHEYNVMDKDGKIETKYEPYRIIDFFIDVGYQTLIVDEVHDFIQVQNPEKREDFHRTKCYDKYPAEVYDRYELFDDYYFIPKDSLYKKLKALADKAARKIFLTATPIKSDMVDFYLLTLLASNKDSEDYRRISEKLHDGSGRFANQRGPEQKIHDIYNTLLSCIEYDDEVSNYFKNNSNEFFRLESRDTTAAQNENRPIRYIYPYFNNEYLRDHVNSKTAITEYLLSQINYLTVEEIVMELILAYQAEIQENVNIGEVVDRVVTLLGQAPSMLQVRVIFRALLNNTVRIRFEEDFTNTDGKAIKRIRDLMTLEDGPRRWHKTYRKYGIRHTRHQTYNLSKCDKLECLSQNRIDRYRNLPLWPRREGIVFYLNRDDVFFDSFQKVRREIPSFGSTEIQMHDLPNFDKMAGEEEEKKQRFDNSLSIFNYINDAMSGGDPVKHEPKNTYKNAFELDESMVDYKLVMISQMMGNQNDKKNKDDVFIKGKVLLFAQNHTKEIVEWFRYQRCPGLYDERAGNQLDPQKLAEYHKKWENTSVRKDLYRDWAVTEGIVEMDKYPGNLLIIIDPQRYEKGVDLQKANTLINFDIEYCPLKMEQRIGRIDRIRPSSQEQQISIVSFVPQNNMSGYVINFFANELKMFTQWMGETTGIVSVPEENKTGNTSNKSEAFEDKVHDLDKFYKGIYNLCRGTLPYAAADDKGKNIPNKDNKNKNLTNPSQKNEQSQELVVQSDPKKEFENVESMSTGFVEAFGCDSFRIESDFRFLFTLRESFDKAFRESMSRSREGFQLGSTNEYVMRFNCTAGIYAECAEGKCDSCNQKADCLEKNANLHNRCDVFLTAIKSFYNQGAEFYDNERKAFDKSFNEKTVMDNNLRRRGTEHKNWLEQRKKLFAEGKSKSEQMINQLKLKDRKGPFTVPIADFNKLFDPMKQLYWDDVVMTYIGLILDRFHSQCDSVLKSATLFEKFVKTLAVADFMNNMEGTV